MMTIKASKREIAVMMAKSAVAAAVLLPVYRGDACHYIKANNGIREPVVNGSNRVGAGGWRLKRKKRKQKRGNAMNNDRQWNGMCRTRPGLEQQPEREEHLRTERRRS